MKRDELRQIYLYEYRNQLNATKTAQKINNAFGANTTSQRTVQRWFKEFRNGNTDLQDKKNRGKPNAVDLDKLKELVEKHPDLTAGDYANMLGVSLSAVLQHLK